MSAQIQTMTTAQERGKENVMIRPSIKPHGWLFVHKGIDCTVNGPGAGLGECGHSQGSVVCAHTAGEVEVV